MENRPFEVNNKLSHEFSEKNLWIENTAQKLLMYVSNTHSQVNFYIFMTGFTILYS